MEWVQARGVAGGSEAVPGLEALSGSWSGWVLGLLAVALMVRLLVGAFAGTKRRPSGGRRRTVQQPAPLLDASLPLAAGRPTEGWVSRGAEQMWAVEAGDYERKPLLNRGEARVLRWLDGAAEAAGQGHRVMAQVALNEVIRPKKDAPGEALGAIVAKRLDFAIVDRDGWIACAVEFQGRGHWGNHAAMRDAVKREALRKAGVRMVEVHHDATEKWVRETVGDLLGNRDRSGNNSDAREAAPS